MKKEIVNGFGLLACAAFSLTIVSCNKEDSAAGSAQSAAGVQVAAASVQALAVAATSSAPGSDSVYVINTCGPREHRDSLAISSLPASIGTYLTANYAGFTGEKAYSVKDNTGTLKGYVVVVQYNGKPVGLKFDATGNFVQVLEQREGHDLQGSGWHKGGRFDDRDGARRDTLAISALPAAIRSYLAYTYASDTLVRAFKGKDSSYIVLSFNNGVFATVFDASGSFVKRIQLNARAGKPAPMEQSALPATVTSYLGTTYPNYVFKSAFRITSNNVSEGYVVFIDANNTRYAVQFDASGVFVAAKTVR